MTNVSTLDINVDGGSASSTDATITGVSQTVSAVTYSSNGNVGIGTNSPKNGLSVEKNAISDLAIMARNTSAGNTTAGQVYVGACNSVDDATIVGIRSINWSDGFSFLYSTGKYLDITIDAGVGSFTGNTTDTTVGSIRFNTSSNTSNYSNRAVISATGYFGINNSGPAHYIDVISNSTLQRCVYATQQNASGFAIEADATSGSYASSVHLVVVTRAANTAYSFFDARSSGAADIEFNLRGDGTGLCDGSWTGGGADYAEYFEWADGNTLNEDRRGYSVVLSGNKLRFATANDLPTDIIGVITGNPSVVGDAAWNKWSEKYLRDDFGSYIQENYEVWEWTETVQKVDEVSGNEIIKNVTVSHSYAFDSVPENVIVPENKTVIIQQRRVLNPSYDPNLTYTPREARPEWSVVGMMGKLRLRKGQPTGERWIKMRDVSDLVEEWLVR